MLYKNLLNRKPVEYSSPEEFLQATISYFQWAEETPIQEQIVNFYKGAVVRTHLEKLRPFTKQGLATFLGITVGRLETLKKRDDEWRLAIEMIEQVIYEQKFTGAATGLLNAGIITRDLGLAERQELTGRDGEPLQQVVQYQLPDNGRDPETPNDPLTDETDSE